MKSRSSLSKNVILNSVYQVLLVIIPLVTAPYISRVLLVDGIGVYSYTHSLMTYFSLLAALGTISYGTREIARSRDKQNEFSKKFWEIEMLVVFTTVVSLLFWLLLVFLYKEYQLYLLLLSIQIVAVCLDISWLYAGLEKFSYIVLINSVFKILGCVSIFLFVKKPTDLWIYFLINSLALFLGHLSMWIFLPRVLCKAKPVFSSIFDHLKGTMVFFIPAIATSIYTLLDKTLIGLLIPGTMSITNTDGTETVKKIAELENGYYEQATKIINIAKAVCFIGIVGVMTSRSSYLHKNGDESGVKKIVLNTLNITSFLSIGACFGLIAIAKTFVPTFFGEGYDSTIILLYILAPLIFVISLSYVLGGVYYSPVGKRKQSSIYLIIGASINLVLNIPFIILWKSIGAAIASLIAELIICFLYLKGCGGVVKWKEVFKLVWKKMVAGVVMFVCVWLFSHFLGQFLNKYVLLVLQMLIGVASYSLFTIFLKDESLLHLIRLFLTKRKKVEDNKEKPIVDNQ